jgi:hypothetical protein
VSDTLSLRFLQAGGLLGRAEEVSLEGFPMIDLGRMNGNQVNDKPFPQVSSYGDRVRRIDEHCTN